MSVFTWYLGAWFDNSTKFSQMWQASELPTSKQTSERECEQAKNVVFNIFGNMIKIWRAWNMSSQLIRPMGVLLHILFFLLLFISLSLNIQRLTLTHQTHESRQSNDLSFLITNDSTFVVSLFQLVCRINVFFFWFHRQPQLQQSWAALRNSNKLHPIRPNLNWFDVLCSLVTIDWFDRFSLIRQSSMMFIYLSAIAHIEVKNSVEKAMRSRFSFGLSGLWVNADERTYAFESIHRHRLHWIVKMCMTSLLQLICSIDCT